ncbi:MAG: VWA domain-containing protein, partial [Phyllobacteriaceae bacterium]|nr:VWA domain-containing protein [Phyllobacteriaceae bacterium]
RFRRRERRMGHLVLFVVDGSGSMGAQRRMVAVKGAVQSLLIDCYQRRDRVGLIVFRKDRAELVLPPTRSVEMAGRRLATLPVGGKTPLAAGLLEAARVVERARLREPETRVLMVVLSDGRANHSLTGSKPLEEVRRAVGHLSAMPGLDVVVVDTEDKRSFHRTDLARALATDLRATYSTIEDLAARDLVALVRNARTDIRSAVGS